MKFGPFLPAPNKLTNFRGADLESRIQFWPKLSMALQYDKINLLWVFFGSGNLLFRAKKARKFKIWTLFARSKKIQHFLGGLFWKHNSILDQTLHGPSVSHNRAPVKVFWFKQFTFQRIERNEIWNLDPFSPLERNWPISFLVLFAKQDSILAQTFHVTK